MDYIHKSYEKNNIHLSNPDQLFRLKLLVEEYKFEILASELLRVNRFFYDDKVTVLLVNRFRKAIEIIDEYIENNYDGLFIFTPRLYTLKSLSQAFSHIGDFSSNHEKGEIN